MGKHVDTERPRRHKHEDFPTAATRIKEHQAAAIHQLHGTIKPGTGTHRSDDTEAAA